MNSLKRIISLILLLILTVSFCELKPVFALNVPRTTTTNIEPEFYGKWNMQTIVTSSNCPYILTGTTTESNLEIKPAIIKKKGIRLLKAFWKGGKWTDSTGTIKFLSKNEAISERITRFKTSDRNSWKSILIDHLKLTEDNTIHSESIVLQYKNGKFIGEYKTFSILTKTE